jgi:DNA-binding response OmpR family regulator
VTRLLIVDDEEDLIAELKPLLERTGFEVEAALNGEQALASIAVKPPDLIVLDVLIPGVDGREVLRRLRQANDWTPVILLTLVGTSAERTLSLQEGADDYLNKPYDPLELIARIQAVLRRSQRRSLPLISYQRLVSGDLVLNRQMRQATLAGKTLPVSARAISVLEYLMLNANEVITRDGLLDHVWGWLYPVETRAVDIRIAELRKALDDDASSPRYIETVIGQGYRFLGEVEGR